MALWLINATSMHWLSSLGPQHNAGCSQLHSSTNNRHWLIASKRHWQLSTDIRRLCPGCSKPAACYCCCRLMGQTDGRTDTRAMHRRLPQATTNPSSVNGAMRKSSFNRRFVQNHCILHVIALHSNANRLWHTHYCTLQPQISIYVCQVWQPIFVLCYWKGGFCVFFLQQKETKRHFLTKCVFSTTEYNVKIYTEFNSKGSV